MDFTNDHPLKADVIDGEVNDAGTWFVLYRCQGIIKVLFTLMDGSKKISSMKSKRGGQVQPFKAVRFISPIAQDIDFGISDLPIFDNDVGSINVDGISQIVTVGPVSQAEVTATIPNGAPAILVAENLQRAEIVIVPDVDCHIGSSNVTAANSRVVKAGTEWSTTGTFEIWAVDAGAAGGADLTFIEEESF